MVFVSWSGKFSEFPAGPGRAAAFLPAQPARVPGLPPEEGILLTERSPPPVFEDRLGAAYEGKQFDDHFCVHSLKGDSHVLRKTRLEGKVNQ